MDHTNADPNSTVPSVQYPNLPVQESRPNAAHAGWTNATHETGIAGNQAGAPALPPRHANTLDSSSVIPGHHDTAPTATADSTAALGGTHSSGLEHATAGHGMHVGQTPVTHETARISGANHGTDEATTTTTAPVATSHGTTKSNPLKSAYNVVHGGLEVLRGTMLGAADAGGDLVASRRQGGQAGNAPAASRNEASGNVATQGRAEYERGMAAFRKP